MCTQTPATGCPPECLPRHMHDPAAFLPSTTTAHTHIDEADSACLPATTLAQLVQDNLRDIYGLIYSNVGNREEAEALTGQVFITATHQIVGRTPKDAHDLLVGLAHTVVADSWRAFSSSGALGGHDVPRVGRPGPHPQMPQATATTVWSPTERVEHVLRRLPERERAVVIHRLLQSRSVRETAQAMRLSETEVQKLLYRALTLAAELDPMRR